MQFTNPDRIHRAEIQSTPTVLVALEPDTSILQENWKIDGAVSSRFTTTRRDGLAKVLMRWVGGQTATVCLIVDRGPPIRIQGPDVMEAWRANPGQLVKVDRSKTTRRIPLTVQRDDIPIQEGFEVVYRPGGNTLNLSLGQGKLLEKDSAGLQLALRDDDELPCMLLHPEHQPLAFTVPEKSGPEKTLELQLVRGVPLSFDVTFDKQPSPNAVMTLRVRKRTAGTYIINTIADLPELAPEDLGKPIRIQCPAALPEGRFNVYLRIPGLPTLSADANLEAGGSVVLEIKPKSS